MSETLTKEEIAAAKATALNRYDPQFEHFCNRCGKTVGFDGFVYCKCCGRELRDRCSPRLEIPQCPAFTKEKAHDKSRDNYARINAPSAS
jgi:hypothetical protein